MDNNQINVYGGKLCENIKLHYLNDFSRCDKKDDWPFFCQLSMRNFVLSRQGWQKNNEIEDSFIFCGKNPITINILYSNSPGMLMVDTAIGIAKAELIDNFNHNDKENNLEHNISEIVKCIEDQDWIIPFIRSKIKE